MEISPPPNPYVGIAVKEAKPTSLPTFGDVVTKQGRPNVYWLVLNPNDVADSYARTVAIRGTRANMPWKDQVKTDLEPDSWGGSTDEKNTLTVVGSLSYEDVRSSLLTALIRDFNLDEPLTPENETELLEPYLGDWKRHLEAENQSAEAGNPTDLTLAELATS